MKRRSRASPTRCPMKYSTSAPPTEPLVAAISTPTKPSLPCATEQPDSGRITSEGIGGIRFSGATRNAMPT